MVTRRMMLRGIDTARIETAIAQAELRTSGEIRVSLAAFFLGDVQRMAMSAMERLGMTRTTHRNGVLIFVVPSRRRFAVIGDTGIHAKVGQALWEEVVQAMAADFRKGSYTEGIVAGIERLAIVLASHSPRVEGDVDELPDHVDRGR